MGLSNWGSIITDRYERTARLYPALLAMLPALIALAITSVFDKPMATQILTLSGSCGAAYLLASIARMAGKAKENELYEKWGGIPTTQLLRYRSEVIDLHTKQRYHGFLARKIKIEFPKQETEYQSPEAADEIYRAGVKWLLGKTRDKKRFALLFKENVSYGFHRNGLGLRWLGTLIGLFSFSWLLLASHAYDPKSWSDLKVGQMIPIVMELVITLVWATYFSENRVKQAANAYADMLLRTCDELR